MTDKQRKRAKRDAAVVDAYVSGKTLKQIGERHGITRERVRQILADNGVERRSVSETAQNRKETAVDKHGDKVAKVFQKHGSVAATVKELSGVLPASSVKELIAEIPLGERLAAKRHLAGRGRSYSEKDMRSAVKRADKAGYSTIAAYREWRETPAGRGSPSVPLLIMRFGSWANARAAVGLDTAPAHAGVGRHRVFTDAEITTAVYRFVSSCREQGVYPSAQRYDAYAKRAGLPAASTVRQRTNKSWLEILSEVKVRRSRGAA